MLWKGQWLTDAGAATVAKAIFDSRDVDLGRAHAGVVWLAAEFRGSPQMPVDLMEAA